MNKDALSQQDSRTQELLEKALKNQASSSTSRLPLELALAVSFYETLSNQEIGISDAAKLVGVETVKYSPLEHWPRVVAKQCFDMSRAFLTELHTDPQEKWEWSQHRDELRVSPTLGVYHPVHGPLCWLEITEDFTLYHPIQFREHGIAARWITKGSMEELQAEFATPIRFSNKSIEEKK